MLECLSGFLLIALFLMVTTSYALPVSHTDSCSPNCTCVETEIKCSGVIPYTVPEPVKTVVLTWLKPTDFSPARFCYVSWKNVTDLIIESVISKELMYFHLVGGVFDCLNQIEAFRFSSGALYKFAETTFSGLTNLSTFDLSGCKMVLWEDVAKTLSVPSNFPNLERLILSQTGVHELLMLDNDFIEILSLRPIVYLDLSFTLLSWDFSDPGKLCDTLTYLKYEGAQVLHSEIFTKCNVCQSLQILDDSNDKFYKTLFQNVTCKNAIQYFRTVSPFFNNMRVLYMNSIVTGSEMFTTSNCFWVLWPGTQLTELHFAHNYLPNFDVKLYNTHLETIDLQHNKMESINKDAFRYLLSLQSLDLSHNNFGQSQDMSDTFSALFSRNENLTVIDLSANGLTSLPGTTFATNTDLRKLLLADNLLDQLTFNISHLVDLVVLDLRRNSIKSLNKVSRNYLDELYKRQVQNHSGAFVQILMNENPFSCSCDSLDFLQWFDSSPLFSASRCRYFCDSNGQHIAMGDDAVDASSDDCARIKRRRLMILLLSTLIPTGVFILILALVVCHKRRKSRMLNQRFRDGIQRLRRDTNRFPVFLSCSSDDSDLVKSHILRTLQVHHSLLYLNLRKQSVG